MVRLLFCHCVLCLRRYKTIPFQQQPFQSCFLEPELCCCGLSYSVWDYSLSVYFMLFRQTISSSYLCCFCFCFCFCCLCCYCYCYCSCSCYCYCYCCCSCYCCCLLSLMEAAPLLICTMLILEPPLPSTPASRHWIFLLFHCYSQPPLIYIVCGYSHTSWPQRIWSPLHCSSSMTRDVMVVLISKIIWT